MGSDNFFSKLLNILFITNQYLRYNSRFCIPLYIKTEDMQAGCFNLNFNALLN